MQAGTAMSEQSADYGSWVDWSTAVVTVEVQVHHTAQSDTQKIQVPLETLVAAVSARMEANMCERVGCFLLPSQDICARCGKPKPGTQIEQLCAEDK